MTDKYLKPDRTWHLSRAEVDHINTLNEQIEQVTRERDDALARIEPFQVACRNLDAKLDDALALLREIHTLAGERRTRHKDWDGRGGNPLLDTLLSALAKIEARIAAFLERTR